MFHWNLYTTYDASRFVLTVPMHYMALLVSIPAVLIVLAFGMKAGHIWRNWALVALLVFGCGFLSYSTELTLDRTTGKATLREFEFFHWTTSTFDLNRVDRVYVATGSTNDQLRLQFTDGTVEPLSFVDQYGGKERVAHEAEQFLGSGMDGH